MKVILLRDVAKIGKKGSVVQVPDGYAQNQLIPTRSAEAATPQNLKKHTRSIQEKEAAATAEHSVYTEVVAKMNATKLDIKVEANEKGHLFKAVSKEDVQAAAVDAGISFDGIDISFAKPLKAIGEHEVVLSHAGEQAKCIIVISKK